jgi:hypothetical protein
MSLHINVLPVIWTCLYIPHPGCSHACVRVVQMIQCSTAPRKSHSPTKMQRRSNERFTTSLQGYQLWIRVIDGRWQSLVCTCVSPSGRLGRHIRLPTGDPPCPSHLVGMSTQGRLTPQCCGGCTRWARRNHPHSRKKLHLLRQRS